jgi:hypothetical protein
MSDPWSLWILIVQKRNVAKDVQTSSLFADNLCCFFNHKKGEIFGILLFF